jgi:hypothetical protein
LEPIIILDAQKLRTYFDEIKAGFYQSPRETILSIIIIALIIIAPIILFTFWQKRQHRKAEKEARQQYRKQIEEKHITPEEEMALEELITCTSRGERDAALLLSDRRVFNSAVKKMLKDDTLDDSIITSIRIKLGLSRSSMNAQLWSTGDFLEGMPVRMLTRDRGEIFGHVESVSHESFVLSLPGRVALKALVRLEIVHPGGLFSATCPVLNSGGGLTEFGHSERISKIQNRTAIRRKLRLPVFITPVENDGKHYRSRIFDLSIGGAKIGNSGVTLKEGQNIVITLPVKKGKPVNISAVVKRSSKNENTFSAQFVDIADSTKEKIMGMVFH